MVIDGLYGRWWTLCVVIDGLCMVIDLGTLMLSVFLMKLLWLSTRFAQTWSLAVWYACAVWMFVLDVWWFKLGKRNHNFQRVNLCLQTMSLGCKIILIFMGLLSFEKGTQVSGAQQSKAVQSHWLLEETFARRKEKWRACRKEKMLERWLLG